MNPIRSLGRTLLASVFVMEGVDTITNASSKVSAFQDVAEPLGETVPAARDLQAEQLVRATGAAQVLGGALLAIGKLPRIASTVLAATLVPATLAEHRFWEETDEDRRTQEQVQFGKNVGLLGGLLIAAMDTAGRPGVVWRAGHAADHAEIAAKHTRREARLAAKLAKAEARRARAEAGRGIEKTKRTLTPDLLDLVGAVRSDDD